MDILRELVSTALHNPPPPPPFLGMGPVIRIFQVNYIHNRLHIYRHSFHHFHYTQVKIEIENILHPVLCLLVSRISQSFYPINATCRCIQCGTSRPYLLRTNLQMAPMLKYQRIYYRENVDASYVESVEDLSQGKCRCIIC